MKLGCKHSKVDQTSAPVYKSCGFLGQRPISSSKCCLKLITFHDDLMSPKRGLICKVTVSVFLMTRFNSPYLKEKKHKESDSG